jgi:uncharacterized protein with PIN domain
MINVIIRFYAELNDHLPAHRRYRDDSAEVAECSCVKDVIEASGVPVGEVDMVLLNGESVDLQRTVVEGERLSVYPVFESFDIASIARIRPTPLRECRFVLDVHLGKLAYHLRMLGFDTVYRNDMHDEELLRLSIGESRILLSKDNELLTAEDLTRGYCVRAKDPADQLVEVMQRFDLFGSIKSFQRCIKCNALLASIDKAAILHRIPPRVSSSIQEFQHCPNCDRIYWKGTHYDRMQAFIDRVMRFAIVSSSMYLFPGLS